MKLNENLARCTWVNQENKLYVDYHDSEWGVPSRDDHHLFELLILEGAQAGLSWETILKKRAHYRKVYKNFDPRKVAGFTTSDETKLLGDPGIVRNRLKVSASVANARAFLQVQREFGSFAKYLWSFVDNQPVQNRFEPGDRLPSTSPLSDRVSRDLKRRGFRFVGSTIVYAYFQAVGVVNDHLVTCHRYRPVQKLARAARTK